MVDEEVDGDTQSDVVIPAPDLTLQDANEEHVPLDANPEVETEATTEDKENTEKPTVGFQTAAQAQAAAQDPQAASNKPEVHATYKVKYAGGQSPIDAVAQLPKGVSTANTKSESIKWLNELAEDTLQKSNFRVLIERLAPSQYMGYNLPVGRAIMETPPMPFNALVEAVRERHGGGHYKASGYNANSQMQATFNFEIFEVDYPPKVPRDATRAATNPHEMSPFGSSFNKIDPNMPSYAYMTPEGKAISEVRAEEIKIQSETSRIQASTKRFKAEQDFEELKEKAERKREETEMRPVLEMERRMSEFTNQINSKLENITQQPKDDGKLELILKMMEEGRAIHAEAQKAQAQAQAETTKATAEAQKEAARIQSEAAAENNKLLLTLMTAMLTKDNKSETEEMLKLMQASNDRYLALINQPNKTHDELFKLMIAKVFAGDEKKTDTLEEMQKYMSFAKTTSDMFNGGGGGEEGVINPEGGFWQNLGNVALSWMKDGAPAMLSGLGQAFAARPMAAAPAPMDYQAPIVTPPQQQALPAPAPVQATQDPIADQLYDGVYDDQSGTTQATNPPQQSTSTVNTASHIDELGQERLFDTISETIQQAIIDVKDGVNAPDWVTFAFDKWPQVFRNMMANAADDSARVQLIQRYCDQTVFNEFHGLMMSSQQAYQNFIANLNHLAEQFRQAA